MAYKSKTKTYNEEELINELDKDLNENYQIGLHQVGVFGNKNSVKKARSINIFTKFKKLGPKDFCNSIVKNGLMNKYEEVFYTMKTYGDFGNIKENKGSIKSEFIDYLTYSYEDYLDRKGGKDIDTVIIAVPSEVEINGKKYNIGNLKHPGETEITDKSLMVDNLFNKKDIPREFIYGYIHSHEGKYDLVKNLKHYSIMTKEEKENYIKQYLEKNEVDISSLKIIDNTNKSFTNELKEKVNSDQEICNSTEKEEIKPEVQEKENLEIEV